MQLIHEAGEYIAWGRIRAWEGYFQWRRLPRPRMLRDAADDTIFGPSTPALK